MAFRASNTLAPAALEQAKQVMLRLKSRAAQVASALAQSRDADYVLGILPGLLSIRAELFSLGATPGLAAYAQEVENDGTYDVVAEFNGVIAAIDAVRDEIVATFPKDGDGYLLSHTLDANGNRVPRVFAAAGLNNLAALLVALAGSIE